MSEVEFFNVEGAQIAYDFMPASANCEKLLVLINGYQRSRLDFRAFRARLAKLSSHTATLALDNRYSGQTVVSSTEPLTIKQMARDVAALAESYCQKLGLKTYCVLGISMGGMIAQTLAADNPHIEKLFLVSTTAGGASRIWNSSGKKIEKLEYKNTFETLESTRKHMLRYFGERFLKSTSLLFEVMCKNLYKENVQALEKAEKQEHKTNKKILTPAEIQFYPSIQYDGIELLSRIHAQTFIFSGDEDKVIPVENASFLKKQIVGSTLQVYEGIGHLILIEEPDKFSKDIASLLSVE